MDIEHAVSEIRTNWRRKDWWQGRIEQRLNSPVQSRIKPPSSELSILNREWSTLVVVDACREDLFKEIKYPISFDEIQSATSIASATPEWLKRTFGNSHGEIVYVAGNPMVSRHCPGKFHDLIEIWQDAYDPNTAIIDPQQVTEAAIEAHRKYNNKRIIVHYMQPHYPFIDRPELNYADYKFEDLGMERRKNQLTEFGNVWNALKAGAVKRDDVWEGYKHNLQVVLAEVSRVASHVDERMVVTSDHGNALGERSWPVPLRTFGHPENQRLSSLVRVPWAVLDGPKRSIVEEETTSSGVTTDEEVQDRLRNLGYV